MVCYENDTQLLYNINADFNGTFYVFRGFQCIRSHRVGQ